jgi:hypothetical protein
MTPNDWVQEFPCSITVCDREGVILEMNQRSVATFAGDGGRALIGTNLLGCHPEPSRTQLEGMLRDRTTNVYTIEKSGVKKLIFQSPWYRDGEYAGFVELSLEVPFAMEHFIRTA